MLINRYPSPARGKVVKSCNIRDGVGGGLVEDRGDEMADLEAAVSGTWSWARANARTERLEALRAARLEQWRATLAEWAPGDIAELTRLLGQLTTVDLR